MVRQQDWGWSTRYNRAPDGWHHERFDHLAQNEQHEREQQPNTPEVLGELAQEVHQAERMQDIDAVRNETKPQLQETAREIYTAWPFLYTRMTSAKIEDPDNIGDLTWDEQWSWRVRPRRWILSIISTAPDGSDRAIYALTLEKMSKLFEQNTEQAVYPDIFMREFVREKNGEQIQEKVWFQVHIQLVVDNPDRPTEKTGKIRLVRVAWPEQPREEDVAEEPVATWDPWGSALEQQTNVAELLPQDPESLLIDEEVDITCARRHIEGVCGHDSGNRKVTTNNLQEAIDQGKITLTTTHASLGGSINNPVEVEMPIVTPRARRPHAPLQILGRSETQTWTVDHPAHPWQAMLVITARVMHRWSQTDAPQLKVDVRIEDQRSTSMDDGERVPEEEKTKETLTQDGLYFLNEHGEKVYCTIDTDQMRLWRAGRRPLTEAQQTKIDALVVDRQQRQQSLIIALPWRWRWQTPYVHISQEQLAELTPQESPEGKLMYHIRMPSLQSDQDREVRFVVDDRQEPAQITRMELLEVDDEFLQPPASRDYLQRIWDQMRQRKDNIRIGVNQETADMPWISETIVTTRWGMYAKPTVEDTETQETVEILGFDTKPVPLDPATQQDIDGLQVTQSIWSWTSFVLSRTNRHRLWARFELQWAMLDQEIRIGEGDNMWRIVPHMVHEGVVAFAVAPPRKFLVPTREEKEVYRDSRMVYPIDTSAPGHNTVTSIPGMRTLGGRTRQHNGIDIAIPQGTPLISPARGEVVFAGTIGSNRTWTWGTVIIRHPVSLQGRTTYVWTKYAHLSSIAVKAWDTLQAWQQVWLSWGRPWTPGAWYSTGPHLHRETRTNATVSRQEMDRILQWYPQDRTFIENNRLDPRRFHTDIEFDYTHCGNCRTLEPESTPRRRTAPTPDRQRSRERTSVTMPPEVPTHQHIRRPSDFEINRRRPEHRGRAGVERWVYPPRYTRTRFLADLQRNTGISESIPKENLSVERNAEHIHQFIERSRPFMEQVATKYNVPAELIWAVAILETHLGASGIGRGSNNLFNIRKWTHWLWPYRTNGGYRVYISWEHSVMDFARLMNTNRYKDTVLKSWLSLQQRVEAMRKAWYATDPQYVEKMMWIIRSYNLAPWETERAPETSPFTSTQKQEILRQSSHQQVRLEEAQQFVIGSRTVTSYRRWVTNNAFSNPYNSWRLAHTTDGSSTQIYLIDNQQNVHHLDINSFAVTHQSVGNLVVGESSGMRLGNQTADVRFTIPANGYIRVEITPSS